MKWKDRHAAIDAYIVAPIESNGVVRNAYEEFDVDAIANEVLYFDEKRQAFKVKDAYCPDEDHVAERHFWAIVERYAIDEKGLNS